MSKKVVEFLNTGKKEYDDVGYVETIAICSLPIMGEGNDGKIFRSIGEFMDYEIQKNRKKSGKLFVKNLDRTGPFIMEYLFSTGAPYNRGKLESEGEYSVVMSSGQIYEIKILVSEKPRQFVSFTDIDKLAPLKKKDLNSGFELKLKNYNEDDIRCDENIDILLSNTAEYAKLMSYIIAMDLDGMTLSSRAFSHLKKSVPNFRHYYKKTRDDEYDFIHPSYHAGYNDINDEYVGKDLGEVISLDVNSMFSSILRNNLLPFGDGVYYEGKWEQSGMYPLAVQKIRFSMAVVKYDKTAMLNPYIGIMKSMGKYIDEIDSPMEIVLSNIMLDSFLDNYYVYDLEYIDGYMYHGRQGSFEGFVDKWMGIKVAADRTGDKAMRTIAKMVMNYSYGGFGKRRDRMTTYIEDGVEISKETKAMNRYLPVAIFTTSYAIKELVDIKNEVGDRFIYADVDSVHLIGHEIPKVLEGRIHSDKLGYWKVDGKFDRARFLKLKTYIEQNDDETVIRASGAGDEIKGQMNFDNFKYGSTFDGMIRTRKVKGGSLKDTFTYKL